jgi:hypothetical protein
MPSRCRPGRIEGSEQVHVIVGSDTVSSLNNRSVTFRGYTMAYQAGTGRLLYACLGQDCPRKEFS